MGGKINQVTLWPGQLDERWEAWVPSGRSRLHRGLAGAEGPLAAEVPDWSSEARAWEGGVDHGRGREGNTGTSKGPVRPCRIKGRS